MDAVQQKAAAIVYRGVKAAYGTAGPADVPWCECGHCDDDHHGKDGELACSVCGCQQFRLAEVRRVA